MTISLWATAFTDNVSTVSAAFLNYVRTSLAKAVDGVGGGIISPTAAIEIQGSAGLKINGTGSAARLQYGSRSITRTLDSLLVHVDTSTIAVENLVVGTPSESGRQVIRLPNGSTLTAITAYHDRNTSNPEPGVRVALKIFKQDLTTGTETQIGSTTLDPASTLAAYQLYHGFSISGLTEVIDRTKYIYFVILVGESGANNTATTWYGCTATFSLADQDEAP